MTMVIRPGDVHADRDLAVETFARHLNPRYDGARFDWVYRHNPHGIGRLWVGTNPQDGSVVGIAAAFPRRVNVSGRIELAWVLGDFCVAEAYRAVGPALALQRACLAGVTDGVVPFCYDFPSTSMMAVYRRLGIKPLGRMVRLVRPLSIETRLRGLVKSQTVSRHLGAVASVFLAPRQWMRPAASAVEVALHPAHFGDEFTELWQQRARAHAVMIERSAEYLNWRYRANPVHRHEVITARQAGRLAGYAVVRQDGEVMTLVDVFPDGDTPIIAELIHRALVLARQRGLAASSVSLLESSSWIPTLRRAGYRERDARQVVVYASEKAWPEIVDERAWHLLDGDRDS